MENCGCCLATGCRMDYGISADRCDPCEADFFQLIELLLMDIQHLEAKAVGLRYRLSGFLSKHEGKMLQYDIFSDLSRAYYDQAAYQQYVAKCCSGIDPMDDPKYWSFLTRLAYGKEFIGL